MADDLSAHPFDTSAWRIGCKLRASRFNRSYAKIGLHVVTAGKARARPGGNFCLDTGADDHVESGLADNSVVSAEPMAHRHPGSEHAERIGKAPSEFDCRVDIVQPAQCGIIIAVAFGQPKRTTSDSSEITRHFSRMKRS